MPREIAYLPEKWYPGTLARGIGAIDSGTFEPAVPGEKSARVAMMQEWLTLQGYGLKTDRNFGPATFAAVEAFQLGTGLQPSGQVDEATFLALTRPMTEALTPLASPPADIGAAVVSYARQHLNARARELDRRNLGPWVRLYMNGREGPEWAWCAGFACFVLKQASQTLGLPMPIKPSFSCDVLAERAKNQGRFVAHNRRDGVDPAAGWLFLVRKTPTDWTHVGIVTGVRQNVIWTLEGNTNDEGSREGHEVCARVRAMTSRIDFIRIDTD